MFSYFDGNWIDMLTIAFGAAGIFVKPAMRYASKERPCWVHREATIDLLNAASMAPFILLLISPFNSWVLKEITTGSKVSFGLAGGIGALYVIKEIFSFSDK